MPDVAWCDYCGKQEPAKRIRVAGEQDALTEPQHWPHVWTGRHVISDLEHDAVPVAYITAEDLRHVHLSDRERKAFRKWLNDNHYTSSTEHYRVCSTSCQEPMLQKALTEHPTVALNTIFNPLPTAPTNTRSADAPKRSKSGKASTSENT